MHEVDHASGRRLPTAQIFTDLSGHDHADDRMQMAADRWNTPTTPVVDLLNTAVSLLKNTPVDTAPITEKIAWSIQWAGLSFQACQTFSPIEPPKAVRKRLPRRKER